MKALRWHGRMDLRYEDVPEPSPGPGQVKVKINLAGICGSDLMEYRAGPGKIDPDKVPITIGHEFAGRVAEVGEGVTDLKTGERVSGVGYWICGECFFCKRSLYNICLNLGFAGINADGCMAEYLIAPSYALYRLPDSVSDELGALVEPLAVAIHAVNRGNVRPGDTVAVLGDGTIGLCVMLAARAAGAAEVYMVAKHKSKGVAAAAMGAAKVIYFGEGDSVQLVRDLTGGLGADITFECVGRTDTPQMAVDLARRGGTTVVVGVFEEPGTFDFNSIAFNDKTVVGSAIYIHEGKTAIDWMADGRINPSRLISAKVPLEDAVSKGFEELIANKEQHFKVLLQVP